MKNHIFIILTIAFSQEDDGTWTAVCEELGTSTYGDSFEEVKKEIDELVQLHLNTLEKLGERERFFKENNIPMYYKNPPEETEVRTPLRRNVFVNSYAHEVACA